MNAYPPDLLVHHYPLLLLSGLVAPAASAVDSAASSSAAAAAPLIDASTAFPTLAADLRALVAARGRDSPWDPARGRSAAFRSVLVDSAHRLPPRKSHPLPRGVPPPASIPAIAPIGPPQDAESAAAVLASLPPRSALSPTHPASPLWPDGLIAPVWVRRHREQVGAVWVAVHVLPTRAALAAGRGEAVADVPAGQSEEQEQAEAEQLREADEALIKSIAERKRAMAERGIKLTVVLLTEREMLESPSLEPRLSHIRRSSTLDAKASLFVLTPVPRSDLSAFLTSLHTALYPSAIDYYAEHSRRLRRRRSRYPPSVSSVSEALNALGRGLQPPGLSRDGWNARAEYKLGTFAEFGGDAAAALSHYGAAYAGIIELLRSTAALPPRTKRWAEAKVLSDALSLRMTRLHLYEVRADEAVAQFSAHLTTVEDLCKGWGMGPESAEWWSWAGKQYRLLGDLADLSMRQTPLPLLPILIPPMPANLLSPPSHIPTAQSRGPAGFWYAAGLCAVERRVRYRQMLDKEEKPASANPAGAQSSSWSMLEHERKVDHAGLIAEAFTRADDLAKRAGQPLTAPALASLIANAHLDGGHHNSALRYLQGVVQAYPAVHQPQILDVLLLLVRTAQAAQDVEAELRGLLAVLHPKMPLSQDQRSEAQEALSALLSEKQLPDGAEPVRIEAGATDGLLVFEAAFLDKQVHLGQRAPFQVRLHAPRGTALGKVSFEKLRIFRDEDSAPIVVTHKQSDGDAQSELVQLADLGSDAAEPTSAAVTADLRWSPGCVKVFQGSITSDTDRLVRLSRVELRAGGTRVPLQLVFTIPPAPWYAEPVQARWFSFASGAARHVYLPHVTSPNAVTFRRRPHQLETTKTHGGVAYLDDSTAITFTVQNNDNEPLRVTLDASALLSDAASRAVLIHSSRADDTGTSAAELSLALGIVEPGASKSETFYLRCTGAAGPRVIEVMLRSRPSDAPDAAPAPEDGSSAEADPLVQEHQHTLALEARPMFAGSHTATWRPPRSSAPEVPRPAPRSGHLLNPSDDSASEGGDSFGIHTDAAPASTVADLSSCIQIVGDDAVTIQAVTLALDPASTHLRLEGAGAPEEQDAFAGTWTNGDRWGGLYEIEVLSGSDLGASPEAPDGTVKPTGALQVTWRRAQAEEGSKSNVTSLALPVLLPPHLNTRLLIAAPPNVIVDQPFVALLTVVNPHSTLTADVYVGMDPSDYFVLAGPRTFNIPSLVPRSTRSVPLRMVARAEGQLRMPRVRAWDRRQRFLARDTAAPAPATDGEEDENEYGAPHAGRPASVINERVGLGIPLSVRWKFSGAHLSDEGAPVDGQAPVINVAARPQQ